MEYLLDFRVYYERPVVIDSLNLKLRQIARFSSNVICDEMLSAKCHLHKERPHYYIHMVTSRCYFDNGSDHMNLTVFWFVKINYEIRHHTSFVEIEFS